MKYSAIIWVLCCGVACCEEDSNQAFGKPLDSGFSIQPTAFVGYNTEYDLSINAGILLGYRKYDNSVRSQILGVGPCIGFGNDEYNYGIEFGLGMLDYSGFGMGSITVAVGNTVVKNEDGDERGNFVRAQAGTFSMFSAAINVTYAIFDNDEVLSLGLGIGL